MFLAALGQPQKVFWNGEEIDFDGKIGLFSCTEEVATKRRSKAGPKGARIQVNKNIDSYNLRSVMSCDCGNDYKQAHNGGKRRKRETGSVCDFTFNLVDYDRCVRLCR